MKLLQVSKLYPPFQGGIETVVCDITEGLIQKSYSVDVLCVSDKNLSTIEEDSRGNKIFRCGAFIHLASVYFSLKFILRWLRIRNDYDIIHIHMPNPLANLVFFLFPPKRKIKVVVHWHSDIVKQKLLKYFILPFQFFTLRRSAVILATSEPYLNSSEDLIKYKNKCIVVPIGIVSQYEKVNQEKVKNIREKYKDKKIIFAMGRHVYYKGFEYLIRATENLSDSYVVLLGGDGVLSPKLKLLANELNVQNKVIFLGKVPQEDVASYYAAADAFCLPSIERSEAYGVVQLESMSVGTPVISTSINGSGVSWVNKHNVSGIVVPPKDCKALSEAISKITMPNCINCNKVKEVFMNNFTRNIMVDKIVEVYKNLI
ncbi:glycosyltransferase [Citrobacter braakii]|uniref:glycosyltransferase n=1 Tax=Citrobacter braakii TaxID=57706 RepID=UPI0034E551E2